MRKYAGPTPVTDELLRLFWAKHLPPIRQAFTQRQPASTLDELAQTVNRIGEPAVTPPTVCVAEDIWHAATRGYSPSRHRHHTHTHARSPRAGDQRTPGRGSRCGSPIARASSQHRPPVATVCGYYMRFRDEARRCRPPCSYQLGNGNSVQQ